MVTSEDYTQTNAFMNSWCDPVRPDRKQEEKENCVYMMDGHYGRGVEMYLYIGIICVGVFIEETWREREKRKLC